jgi:hypothetical protein
VNTNEINNGCCRHKKEKILEAIKMALDQPKELPEKSPYGNAAENIVKLIKDFAG